MGLVSNIELAKVLLLDKRYHFWPELLSQCQSVGINPEAFVVGRGQKYLYDYEDTDEIPPQLPASTSYPSWWKAQTYNAWKSHKKIFEEAKSKNVNNLLLMEDDAFIESDFQNIVDYVEPFFEKYNWDMIYFGCYAQPYVYTCTENKHVVRVNGCGGFHGVLMKRRIIEELLKFDPISPYDEIAHRYLHNIFDCYAINPCIISQRDNIFSEVEGTVLHKPSRNF